MEVRELLWLQTSAVLLRKLRHCEAKSLVQDREAVSRGVGSGVYHFSCTIDQSMSSAELSFKEGRRFMLSSCDYPGRRGDILKRRHSCYQTHETMNHKELQLSQDPMPGKGKAD